MISSAFLILLVVAVGTKAIVERYQNGHALGVEVVRVCGRFLLVLKDFFGSISFSDWLSFRFRGRVTD